MKNKSKAIEVGAPMNRAIRTGRDDSQASQMMNLEVITDTNLSGKGLKKGETVTVSKSEAKRLLAIRKNHFRIANK